LISSTLLSLALCAQFPVDQYSPQIQRAEARLAAPTPSNLGWHQAQYQANRMADQHQLGVLRALHEQEVQRRTLDRVRTDWQAVSPQIQWVPRYVPVRPLAGQNPTHVWYSNGGH